MIGARATLASARRQEERDEHAEKIALRGAARLVWMDLAICDSNLEWAATRRRWSGAAEMIPITAWESHANLLAAGIEDGQRWEAVVNAMAALEQLHMRMDARWAGELNDAIVHSLTDARQHVLKAAAVLREDAGLPPTSTG